MSELRTQPTDGIPPVLVTPNDIARAAQQLAEADGPIAIDTERASAYRYNDRAFLLQIRRGRTPIVLIDPEGNSAAISTHLAPVINGEDWVIHAAASDLPCLAWLGLYPGTIFDTELAGRLLGLPQTNLAAMIEEFLGVRLKKAFGDADWSVRPLPSKWLAYAALDVEFLLELSELLADALSSAHKLDWAIAEFAHIQQAHEDITAPPRPHWTQLKGIGALRRPEQLAVARELWNVRDERARNRDLAPGKDLPNKVLLDIARSLPMSPAELNKVRGFPRRRAGATTLWFNVVRDALASAPETWPDHSEVFAHDDSAPRSSVWSRNFPQSFQTYQAIRDDLEDLAAELELGADVLIRPASVRAAVWEVLAPDLRGDSPLAPLPPPSPTRADANSVTSSTPRAEARPVTSSTPRSASYSPADAQVRDTLASEGARSWQIELAAPIIAKRLDG